MRIPIFIIAILIIIFSAINVVHGSVEIKNGSPETSVSDKIQQFILRPLLELSRTFNNFKIDFSRLPLVGQVGQVIEVTPESKQKIAVTFQDFLRGLENINEWVKRYIGLNIILIIKKIGEFFVMMLEVIVRLLKAGLSLLK